MKYLKSYKLFENPDLIIYNNNMTHYDSQFIQTYAFGYIGDKFYMGESHETHGDMYRRLFNQFGARYQYKFPGRVFLNQRVVTFWVFPNEKEFSKIIDDIGDFIGWDLWTTDWKVEILVNKSGNIEKHVSNVWNYEEMEEDGLEVKYIPISKYTGSIQRTPEELRKLHGKYRRPVDVGYTPKFKTWKDYMIPAKENFSNDIKYLKTYEQLNDTEMNVTHKYLTSLPSYQMI